LNFIKIDLSPRIKTMTLMRFPILEGLPVLVPHPTRLG